MNRISSQYIASKEKVFSKTIGSTEISWDLENGICTFNGAPVITMRLFSTYKSMMEAMLQMVGQKRLQLVLQKEGRNSAENDWAIISNCKTFEEGVRQYAKLEAIGGWGQNELIVLNKTKQTMIFRLYNSVEGRYQKKMGICFGSNMVAGKLTGWAEKYFGISCWVEQTSFLAKGDPFDEFYTFPSDKTIDSELTRLLHTDNATRTDMAVAIKQLQNEISIRKAAEEKVSRLAHYDPLTGLLNRVLFYKKINAFLLGPQGNLSVHTLFFIDVDNFKDINDSLGHAVGDMAIQTIAERFKTVAIANNATISRFGGDEFVLFIPGSPDHKSLSSMAIQVALDLLHHCNFPLILDDIQYSMTCSIGIRQFRSSTQPIDHYMKQADIAMYLAKKRGRNQYCFFSSEMQESADRRLHLLNELKKGIEQDEFLLFYQPLFNNQTKIVACEVLLRWRHPTKGIVPAGMFIDILEKSNLMIPLEKNIFSKACETLKKWEIMGLPDEFDHISINISPAHFMQYSFVPFILETINKVGIDASRIILEITEHAMLSDIEKTSDIMQRMNEAGIRMSVDDYGTGYSSLSYLQDLSFSELKIDRSFLTDLSTRNKKQVIMKHLISLAHSMGMKTVAEGIERKNQLDFLIENQCDLFQGFLLGMPAPADEFEDYLMGYQSSGKSYNEAV